MSERIDDLKRDALTLTAFGTPESWEVLGLLVRLIEVVDDLATLEEARHEDEDETNGGMR